MTREIKILVLYKVLNEKFVFGGGVVIYNISDFPRGIMQNIAKKVCFICKSSMLMTITETIFRKKIYIITRVIF